LEILSAVTPLEPQASHPIEPSADEPTLNATVFGDLCFEDADLDAFDALLSCIGTPDPAATPHILLQWKNLRHAKYERSTFEIPTIGKTRRLQFRGFQHTAVSIEVQVVPSGDYPSAIIPCSKPMRAPVASQGPLRVQVASTVDVFLCLPKQRVSKPHQLILTIHNLDGTSSVYQTEIFSAGHKHATTKANLEKVERAMAAPEQALFCTPFGFSLGPLSH
jgi:hypothetical protein